MDEKTIDPMMMMGAMGASREESTEWSGWTKKSSGSGDRYSYILLPHPPTQTPPPPLASHLHHLHLHLSPPGAGPRCCPPACRGGLPGGAAGPAEAA